MIEFYLSKPGFCFLLMPYILQLNEAPRFALDKSDSYRMSQHSCWTKNRKMKSATQGTIIRVNVAGNKKNIYYTCLYKIKVAKDLIYRRNEKPGSPGFSFNIIRLINDHFLNNSSLGTTFTFIPSFSFSLMPYILQLNGALRSALGKLSHSLLSKEQKVEECDARDDHPC